MVLEQEREKKGWKRKELSEKLGVIETHVLYLETGQRNPSYDVLVKLEDLFHKSHRQLFAVADEHQEQDTKKEKEKQ